MFPWHTWGPLNQTSFECHSMSIVAALYGQIQHDHAIQSPQTVPMNTTMSSVEHLWDVHACAADKSAAILTKKACQHGPESPGKVSNTLRNPLYAESPPGVPNKADRVRIMVSYYLVRKTYTISLYRFFHVNRYDPCVYI